MKKAPYHTKQEGQLRAYMESVRGQHVTVNDILAVLKEAGSTVSTATVYRQLEKMMEEGLVTRYVVDSSTAACYVYTGGTHTHACFDHFHFKCEKCGKLIHLSCDEIQSLKRHMLKHHGFELDMQRTVFYGVCQTCREKEMGK